MNVYNKVYELLSKSKTHCMSAETIKEKFSYENIEWKDCYMNRFKGPVITKCVFKQRNTTKNALKLVEENEKNDVKDDRIIIKSSFYGYTKHLSLVSQIYRIIICIFILYFYLIVSINGTSVRLISNLLRIQTKLIESIIDQFKKENIIDTIQVMVNGIRQTQITNKRECIIILFILNSSSCVYS